MIHHRRQSLVKITLLIHEQHLHDQRDRQKIRREFARAAEAGVEIPDQPDGHSERKDEGQVHESEVVFDLVFQHGYLDLVERLAASEARVGIAKQMDYPYAQLNQ